MNINEIDNLTLIMPSQTTSAQSTKIDLNASADKKAKKKSRRKGKREVERGREIERGDGSEGER